MSNIHAYPNTVDWPEPASDGASATTIESWWRAANGRATRLLAGLQRRWNMRRIERFSDHRLQDVGFERDWDGSIRPRQP